MHVFGPFHVLPGIYELVGLHNPVDHLLLLGMVIRKSIEVYSTLFGCFLGFPSLHALLGFPSLHALSFFKMFFL